MKNRNINPPFSFLFVSLLVVTKRASSKMFFSSKNRRGAHSTIQTEEWSLWPRESEGNIYAVNLSMTEDGVVPANCAFRNARLQLLTNKIGAKVQSGKIEAAKPQYFGTYKVNESGDSISHDEFSEMFNTKTDHLTENELYVEDAVLGAYNSMRNGVRVTTENAAVALIFRTLMVSSRFVCPPHSLHF
jgi:hypothetical protein